MNIKVLAYLAAVVSGRFSYTHCKRYQVKIRLYYFAFFFIKPKTSNYFWEFVGYIYIYIYIYIYLPGSLSKVYFGYFQHESVKIVFFCKFTPESVYLTLHLACAYGWSKEIAYII